VEWADRLSTPPSASLRVVLSRVDAMQRMLHFEAGDTAGTELLVALAVAANTL
jgi:hypothetical protein